MAKVVKPNMKTAPAPERPSEAPGDPESYAFVFEQADGVVRRQEAGVDELRGRVGLVMPVSIAVAGLFLQSIFSHPHLDDWAVRGIVVGLVGFTVSFCASLWILGPSKNWAFGMSAQTLIDGYVEAPEPASLAALQRQVAIYLSDAAKENKGRLDKLFRVFQWVLIALVVETGALLFALWRSSQ